MARGVYFVQQREEECLQNVPDKPQRTSVLSKRNSSIMGLPISSPKHQVGASFLCPALISYLIYFLDLSVTGGLIFFHIKNQNWLMLLATLGFYFLPSLIFFIYTMSSIRNWDCENKSTLFYLKWVTLRILQLFFGPFWVIRRYMKRIFWSITALTSNDVFSREDCLEEYLIPSQIELFIFLQAFLQAAPQAFAQMTFVIYQYNNNLNTGAVEVISFISSLLVLSLTLTYFQRFETQRLLGRTEPWLISKPIPYLETRKVVEESEPPPQTPSPSTEADLIEPYSSDDEYEQPVTLPRSPNEPPPLPRPPRPKSIQEVLAWQKRLNNENEEDIIDLSVPIPRKRERVEGLEEDHMVGKFVSFLFWFLFTVSRFLSVILFSYFLPKYIGIIIGIHYIIMIIYQFKKSYLKDIYQILLNLCISMIFLFAPIEYKVKFKNYNLFYIFYMLLILCEVLSMNLTWYFYAEFYGWWFDYLFIVTFVSFFLSIICLLFYNTMLKPKKVFYYID